MIAVLAVLVPAVFVAALFARRAPARQSLPEALESRPDWVRELVSAADAPDVLVYWSTAAATDDSLPGGARLVVDAELPPEAEFVHLYSVAHGARVRSLPAGEVR